MKKALTAVAALLVVSVLAIVMRRQGTKPSETKPYSHLRQAMDRVRDDAMIEREGKKLRLIECSVNTEECAEIVSRVKQNPRLLAALLSAKAMGVSVMPDSLLPHSKVMSGFVVISTEETDEEIISFLTK